MQEDLTYEQSVAHLEQILKDMQSEHCDIDKLSGMTRQATELLAACRAKLTATEEELRSILQDLEKA